MPTASDSLKALLDRAIARGHAPGLVACAVDRISTFASAAAGVASLKTNATMTEDATLCLSRGSIFGRSLTGNTRMAIGSLSGRSKESRFAISSVIPAVSTITQLWPLSWFHRSLIVRKSGKTFRQAFQDLVVRPFHLEPDTFDTFGTPQMRLNHAKLCIQNPDGSFASPPSCLELPHYENEVPAG
ncbi:hypothetical protein JCM11641_002592 [Rhodosporidiobolus odoratus]